MEDIDFSYKIESIGLKNIGEFKDVVSEFRYYFVGSDKNNNSQKRFYVLQANTSNLNVDTFIPVDKITLDILYDWIDKGINPANKFAMKKAIYELLYPEIKYVDQQFFAKNSEEKLDL